MKSPPPIDYDGFLSRLVAAIEPTGELPFVARVHIDRRAKAELQSQQVVATFRSSLGSLCAEKVWNIWLAAFPEDSSPRDLARRCIGARDTNRSELQIELGKLRSELDGRFLLGPEYFAAVYAGFAWWAVARDALASGLAWDEPRPEHEAPPDEWSACFLASLAAAGGATWEEPNNRSARRDFWEWYLQTAVPRAWEETSSEL